MVGSCSDGRQQRAGDGGDSRQWRRTVVAGGGGCEL